MLTLNYSTYLKCKVKNNHFFHFFNKPLFTRINNVHKTSLRSIFISTQKKNKIFLCNNKLFYSTNNNNTPQANQSLNKPSEIKELLKQFKNIPNTLTGLRILSTPIISYFLYQQNYKMFVSLFVVASITDFLDGYIARKYNLKTKLGSIIDPLADKLLIMSTVISMSLIGGPEIIPGWLSTTIILKDVILLAKTALVFNKQKSIGNLGDIKPTFISKINTFLQLIYIGPICFWMIYQKENEEEEESLWFDWVGYIIGATTVISGLSYIGPLWIRKMFI